MGTFRNFSDLKVIVVDDSEQYRLEMVRILKELEVTKIYQAENGLDGWTKVFTESQGNEKFDLVVSDINMPKMNGVEFLEKIRENAKTNKTPFILCSTESEKALVLKAVTLGVANYIIKPFDQSSVKQKVLKVLVDILSKQN